MFIRSLAWGLLEHYILTLSLATEVTAALLGTAGGEELKPQCDSVVHPLITQYDSPPPPCVFTSRFLL